MKFLIIPLLLILASFSVNAIVTSSNLEPVGLVNAPGTIEFGNIKVRSGLFAFITPDPVAKTVFTPGEVAGFFLDYSFNMPSSGVPKLAYLRLDKCTSSGCGQTDATYLGSWRIMDIEQEQLPKCLGVTGALCRGSTTTSISIPLNPGTYYLSFWISDAMITRTFDSGSLTFTVGTAPCVPHSKICSDWGLCGQNGLKYRTCDNGCLENDESVTCTYICTSGQQKNCNVDSCNGTMTCSNNLWGGCVKTDPNCRTGGTNVSSDGLQWSLTQDVYDDSTYEVLLKTACRFPADCSKILIYDIAEGYEAENYSVSCKSSSSIRDMNLEAKKEVCKDSALVTALMNQFPILKILDLCTLTIDNAPSGTCRATLKTTPHGLCLGFANDLLQDVTKTGDCQTNTIILIVVSFVGLVVMMKIIG